MMISKCLLFHFFSTNFKAIIKLIINCNLMLISFIHYIEIILKYYIKTLLVYIAGLSYSLIDYYLNPNEFCVISYINDNDEKFQTNRNQ